MYLQSSLRVEKDTFRTSHFVLSREVVLFSEVVFYTVCIQEYFWLVLCWEICPLSECPLSEVSLYMHFAISAVCAICVSVDKGAIDNQVSNLAHIVTKMAYKLIYQISASQLL